MMCGGGGKGRGRAPGGVSGSLLHVSPHSVCGEGVGVMAGPDAACTLYLTLPWRRTCAAGCVDGTCFLPVWVGRASCRCGWGMPPA
eukprot:227762-Chlamydomonas_euryale.AAC.1